MNAVMERIRWRARMNRGDCITLVDSVDAARPGVAAFKGRSITPDRLERAPAGTVLVRRAGDPDGLPGARRWRAGRVHLDGVRWEEKTWVEGELIALRDHVARLLEAPSRLERLEWQHANALALIRDTQRRQGHLERTSQEYANLAFAIDSFAAVADFIWKEIQALKSLPADMAGAAR